MLSTILTGAIMGGSLGTIFDRVIITAEQRRRIAEYLQKGDDQLSANERFERFLASAHSLIFERFFFGQFLSIRFFVSAATISVVSFSMVFLVQAYLFPDQFSALQITLIQVIIFVSFISFNIIFDYVTIIQTKIFLDASLSSKSILRSTVIVAADLIVTINLFILMYAFFILVAAQFFAFPKRNLILASPVSQIVSPIEEEAIIRRFPEYARQSAVEALAFSGSFSGILAEPDKDTSTRIYLPFLSTFDPNEARFGIDRVLEGVSGLNIRPVGATLTEDADTRPDLAALLDQSQSALERALFRDRISDEENSENGFESEFLVAEFSVDASIIRNIQGAYTIAFHRTDVLENAFPESILSPMALERLDVFVSETVSNRTNNAPFALCFERERLVLRGSLQHETLHIFNECEDIIVFEPFWLSRMDRDLILIGRNLDGLFVPFNTLFITSVLPTFFFYSAIALLFFALVIYSALIKHTNKMRKYFLRAPLAVSGLFVGAALALLGVI